MTKTDLIKLVASECNILKKDSELIVNKVFDVMANALNENEKINVNGFGIFSVKERSARKGINPRTKEEIDIPASRYVNFKSSKTLKDSLN